ncbi:Hypothetical protein BHY_0807 [Borrelia nietonii YOR]|uniref:Uncharacterized protein n=1 Tax=Borrelia nietonii YOR TaxID=1293576 RepID=A0ABM5PI50_9SPIR|nr:MULTISPECIES: hypothetical protein [Borrelia]AHH03758.1 Hypothetical protein BHY_0807 [Borrelia nietonii YOR]AHH14246.1 Hypothetical protein BHW_0040300 [Borrelia hermsii MTW]UPA09430.1 hypothetical protein bhYOR_000760 [Borrelia nietonii YOR]
MANHKNSFFIKAGPREVDFDMDSVFSQHSVDGKIVSLRSEEIKDLLDEKLLKLDSSLAQRHGELVNYLRKVEGRISRVEDEILGRNLNSLEEFDNSNLKAMNLMSSQNEINVKDNEFGELVRKENNLPNVSLDQEELDALLEGLNEISRDDKKSFSSNSNLENDSDVGISFEDAPKNELNGLDIDHNLSLQAENNMHNVVDVLSDKEDREPLGVDFITSQDNDLLGKSPFGAANITNGDGSKGQDLMMNLDGDNKVLREPVVGKSSLGVDLEIKNNAHSGDFVLNEDPSNVESVQEQNVSSYEQDDLREHVHLLDDGLNEIEYSDKNLEDLNGEKFREGNEEASDVNDVIAHEIDGADINLTGDVPLHEVNDGIDDIDLLQKQEIGNISSGLKKLDNFEDVLKADLNCMDLQGCIKDFEEKNLYDTDLSDLEEKLGQDEELDSCSPKEQEIRGDNDTSDFSFADVETIINKFNDNEYLSKIKLSCEERAALVKFISRLEGDLDSSPKGNSFKIKKEYEILQKIKRLLVRE